MFFFIFFQTNTGKFLFVRNRRILSFDFLRIFFDILRRISDVQIAEILVQNRRFNCKNLVSTSIIFDFFLRFWHQIVLKKIAILTRMTLISFRTILQWLFRNEINFLFRNGHFKMVLKIEGIFIFRVFKILRNLNFRVFLGNFRRKRSLGVTGRIFWFLSIRILSVILLQNYRITVPGRRDFFRKKVKKSDFFYHFAKAVFQKKRSGTRFFVYNYCQFLHSNMQN